MLKSWLLIAGLLAAFATFAKETNDDLFASVARLEIEIPAAGMKVLREYNQVWRQARPERIDVQATIREGTTVYTNVAVHLKGSFSFSPIDQKPSLTLNFDQRAPGQRFHGLTKIHLNNSVQDSSYLCEQLARELFISVGVPAPRAGHALVKLNDRNLGLYVLIEGANKQFVKRNFPNATKGNLYDGGSGGDVTKALKADTGENPDDRSDLTNLVAAANERDVTKRLARLEKVLDVDRFITFAATEAFLVHWDGYALGCNNYRVFHDTERDKMIFIPHGMDQLFGTSSSPTLSITPPFKGMVAKKLFGIPEARRRYLARLENLSTNDFRLEKLRAHVERLAEQVRPALRDNLWLRTQFNSGVSDLQDRIKQRTISVAQQLKAPRPVAEDPAAMSRDLNTGDTTMRSFNWSFKSGPTPASASRGVSDKKQILQVNGRAEHSSGAWRTTLLLNAGHYEFTGLARTDGLTAADLAATNGVILRISGVRETNGIAISRDWKMLSYEFDVHGVEDVELICEFRGSAPAAGFFDAGSLQLVRKGPPKMLPDVLPTRK